MRRSGRRRVRAWRTAAPLIAAVILVGLLASDANAVGISDPNDVGGPLDIRWVGVTYPAKGWAELTVTFYPGFRRAVLFHRGCTSCGSLWVYLDESYQGVFKRKHGHVVMSYGDHAGLCCTGYRVRLPKPRVLVVRYRPVDEGDPGFLVYAESLRWGRRMDKTKRFRLGPPGRASRF